MSVERGAEGSNCAGSANGGRGVRRALIVVAGSLVRARDWIAE